MSRIPLSQGKAARLIFLGPPGAGKGTQAERVGRALDIPQISTGALLRAEIQAQTVLGKQVANIIATGRLVPDDIVVAMVRERLAEADCVKGYILDGFPRSIPQAQILDGFAQIDAVLLLEVPDQIIVERMAGRRLCRDCGAAWHITDNPPRPDGACRHCGGALITRDDDREDVVRARLRVYHEETAPLAAYYEEKGLLYRVPGQPDVRETTRLTFRTLGVGA